MIGDINFIRNKFEMLSNSIKGNLDVLLIPQTKLGWTFPFNQFAIEGYTALIRFDRNDREVGILLYIRRFVELNRCKKNSHNPAKSNISAHLSFVRRSLDSYMSSYNNFLVIGDLNSEISKMVISKFCKAYNLKNLGKDPTC